LVSIGELAQMFGLAAAPLELVLEWAQGWGSEELTSGWKLASGPQMSGARLVRTFGLAAAPLELELEWAQGWGS
jgi:hypothetical protein